jgi:flagellar biosynthesis protein FlhA
VLLGFALMPGLPTLPFMTLSLLAGGLAYVLVQAKRVEAQSAQEQKVQADKVVPREHITTLPPLDILAVEVGYGLIPLVDAEQNGELLERIKIIRRQMAHEIGIIMPPVHIQDNMQLNPNTPSC